MQTKVIDNSREILIWTATFAIAEGDQVRGRSERPSCGLPSLATAESDQVPKAPGSGLPSLATAGDDLSMTVVYLSKCHPVALFLHLHGT